MTALLTANEAARLRVGVNVIVRPGDRLTVGPSPTVNHGHAFTDYVAPRDWVALTGPCPGKLLEKRRKFNRATVHDGCCRDGRRIVPLYRRPDEPWMPPLLVGSIEVVPVVERVDIALPASFVYLDPDGPGLFRGNHAGFERVADLTLDPLPVPGRDFGIVIDVTELVRR